MDGKLCVAFFLALVAVSCAQASLDKYIETPATDEIRQRCFVYYALHDAIDGNYDERVEQELESDLEEVKRYLGEKVKKKATSARSCFTAASQCSGIGAKLAEIEEKDKICYRWYKFSDLCHKIKARNSGDRQVAATEEWVCKVALMTGKQFESNPVVKRKKKTCPRHIGRLVQKEPEEEFYKVFTYTQQDLERAKEAMDWEMANQYNFSEGRDIDSIERVRQVIKARVANYFNEFNNCWNGNKSQMNKDLAKGIGKCFASIIIPWVDCGTYLPG